MSIKPGVKESKKLFVLLIGIGAVLMIAGVIAGYYTQGDALSSRMFGFGAGFGSAIIAVASVNRLRMRRKPGATRQQEINEKDERNIKIREKSAYDTYFVTMFSLCIAAFVFMCLDSWVACFITVGLLFIHCITYFVFIHRNSKRL